jgi:hypothetical protein
MPATQLHLIRWVDPAGAAEEDARHPDWIWLPILGPSAMLLLLRLQALLHVDPKPQLIDLHVMSQTLGLGTCDSKHAPIFRAMSRVVHFGLAKRMAAGQLAVRCRVADPSPHQLSGLTLPLQSAYRDVLLRRERAGDRDLPASGPSPRADPTIG